MELFMTALSSFLGGSLLTCLLFVVSFSNKVTAMKTSLDDVCKRFDAHLIAPPVCLLHEKLSEEVAILSTSLPKKY